MCDESVFLARLLIIPWNYSLHHVAFILLSNSKKIQTNSGSFDIKNHHQTVVPPRQNSYKIMDLHLAAAIYDFEEYLLSPASGPSDHFMRGVGGRRGVSDELRKRYRAKMLEHHPDKGGNSDKFLQAHEAYEVLFAHFQRVEQEALRQGAVWATGSGAGVVPIEANFGLAKNSFNVHIPISRKGKQGGRTRGIYDEKLDKPDFPMPEFVVNFPLFGLKGDHRRSSAPGVTTSQRRSDPPGTLAGDPRRESIFSENYLSEEASVSKTSRSDMRSRWSADNLDTVNDASAHSFHGPEASTYSFPGTIGDERSGVSSGGQSVSLLPSVPINGNGVVPTGIPSVSRANDGVNYVRLSTSSDVASAPATTLNPSFIPTEEPLLRKSKGILVEHADDEQVFRNLQR